MQRDGRAADADDLAGRALRRPRGGRARAAPEESPPWGSGSRRASTTAPGIALGAVNIPLRDVDFRDGMKRRLGLPVGDGERRELRRVAELAHGAGHGTRDFVMLTLGTGVGGGIIFDGPLFHALEPSSGTW